MKAIKLAEEECCNWSIHKGKCKLARVKRCPYFEGCVLPMVDIVTDKKRKQEIQSAIRSYQEEICTKWIK